MMQIIRICKLERECPTSLHGFARGSAGAGFYGAALPPPEVRRLRAPPSASRLIPAIRRPRRPARLHSQRLNAHGAMITVGEVDDARNGFDPTAMLTDWDTGTVSTLPDGRTLRTFEIAAEDKEIEIAPGVFFPAWTYNGRVPGPTLRATEGDRLRIVFSNAGSHPHSMHFHGIHPRAWMAFRAPA